MSYNGETLVTSHDLSLKTGKILKLFNLCFEFLVIIE